MAGFVGVRGCMPATAGNGRGLPRRFNLAVSLGRHGRPLRFPAESAGSRRDGLLSPWVRVAGGHRLRRFERVWRGLSRSGTFACDRHVVAWPDRRASRNESTLDNRRGGGRKDGRARRTGGRCEPRETRCPQAGRIQRRARACSRRSIRPCAALEAPQGPSRAAVRFARTLGKGGNTMRMFTALRALLPEGGVPMRLQACLVQLGVRARALRVLLVVGVAFAALPVGSALADTTVGETGDPSTSNYYFNSGFEDAQI